MPHLSYSVVALGANLFPWHQSGLHFPNLSTLHTSCVLRGPLQKKATLALPHNPSCQGLCSTLPGYPLILDMLLPNCPWQGVRQGQGDKRRGSLGVQGQPQAGPEAAHSPEKSRQCFKAQPSQPHKKQDHTGLLWKSFTIKTAGERLRQRKTVCGRSVFPIAGKLLLCK